MKKKTEHLSAAEEKKILKTFGRAGLSSQWWKDAAALIKYCHRCGGDLAWRFVEAEGKDRFVCGICEMIFYQNPKIVAATVPVDKDGRVVLLRRAIEPAKGLWTYPAGFMELGETLEEAARRETREEICAETVLKGRPMIYSYSDAAVVTMVYLAEIKGKPSCGEEALEVRTFKPQDVPWRELAFRSTFHGLLDWVRGRFRD